MQKLISLDSDNRLGHIKAVWLLTSLEESLASSFVLRLHCYVLQNERVLFHYNGHGVPRPTANGEIWVFNKAYTQYIPLSIYDLQQWVGSPCIYVFDCSAAGMIVNSYRQFAEQRAKVSPFHGIHSALICSLWTCAPANEQQSPCVVPWKQAS